MTPAGQVLDLHLLGGWTLADKDAYVTVVQEDSMSVMQQRQDRLVTLAVLAADPACARVPLRNALARARFPRAHGCELLFLERPGHRTVVVSESHVVLGELVAYESTLRPPPRPRRANRDRGRFRGFTWTKEQDAELLRLVRAHGQRWDVVRDHLTMRVGREPRTLLNRYRFLARHGKV